MDRREHYGRTVATVERCRSRPRPADCHGAADAVGRSSLDLADHDPGETFGWDKETAKAELAVERRRVSPSCRSCCSPRASGRCSWCSRRWMPAARTACCARCSPGSTRPASGSPPSACPPRRSSPTTTSGASIGTRLPKGQIVVFNRSHYEDVLVVRVKELAPAAVWRKRYAHIRHFEQLLVDEGTAIVKLFLHISTEEQRERLQDRIDSPDERWKFRLGDLDDRKLWPDYMRAYRDALARTSTAVRPVVRRARRPQVGPQPHRRPHPAPHARAPRPAVSRARAGRGLVDGVLDRAVRLRGAARARQIAMPVCTVRQVSVVIPTTLAEAAAALAERPDALVLAGGTDLMVDVNEGHRRVGDDELVVCVNRVPSCVSWSARPGWRHAASRWRRHLRRTGGAAARRPRPGARRRRRALSVRRRSATRRRSAATSSPARRPATGCPCSPPLDATVELVEHARSAQRCRSASSCSASSRPHCVLVSCSPPSPCRCSTAGRATPRSACATPWSSPSPGRAWPSTSRRSVRIALGSVAPTIVRAPEAEAFAAEAVDWDGATVAAEAVAEFGRLAAGGEQPDRRPPLDGGLPTPLDRRPRRAAAAPGVHRQPAPRCCRA